MSMRRSVLMMTMAGLVGCGHHDAGATGSVPLGVPVTVAAAQERTLTIAIDALGTVVPLQQAQIKVRVDGQVISMPGREGEEVEAGALLAQIDPRPYRALRMQQEALTVKDQALLAQAKAETARFQLLAKSGMASQDNLEVAQTQAASLEASVAADRAAVESARLQEEFTSVRAPFAGRLGLHMVDPGAVVHVADAGGLFSISQMAPMSIICSVPQDSLPQLRQAIAAPSKITVDVNSRTGDRMASGVVGAIDNHIDSASGQVQVRVVCGNEDRSLWPGAFVSVHIPLTQRHGVAVPSCALERTQDGWSVFVIDDGAAHLRLVEVGESSGGWTMITHGLVVGASVVTAGSYRLSDGTRVDAHAAAASGHLTMDAPAAVAMP